MLFFYVFYNCFVSREPTVIQRSLRPTTPPLVGNLKETVGFSLTLPFLLVWDYKGTTSSLTRVPLIWFSTFPNKELHPYVLLGRAESNPE